MTTFTPERIAQLRETLRANPDNSVLYAGAVFSALDEIERLSGPSFQDRVKPWMTACFGEEISRDKQERNHRFLEEALELVQSCGCTRGEAYQLVDYVFDRDVGEPSQEVGGVKVTLAALCLAQGLDEAECGETELARIWTKVEKIRAKQATKPKNSPLPQQHYTIPAALDEIERLQDANEELERNAEIVSAEFEKDCWRAMCKLLEMTGYDFTDEGVTADEAFEHLAEDFKQSERDFDQIKAELSRVKAEREGAVARSTDGKKAIQKLKKTFEAWTREEEESIAVIEAVDAFLSRMEGRKDG